MSQSRDDQFNAFKIVEALATLDFDTEMRDGDRVLIYCPIDEIHTLIERAAKLRETFVYCSHCSNPMSDNEEMPFVCDDCWLKKERGEL